MVLFLTQSIRARRKSITNHSISSNFDSFIGELDKKRTLQGCRKTQATLEAPFMATRLNLIQRRMMLMHDFPIPGTIFNKYQADLIIHYGEFFFKLQMKV